MRRRAALVTLAFCALVGCGAPPSEPARRPVWTGAVSEEAFRRLHTLRADEAPPARGEEIDLGGSRAYLSLPEDGDPRAAIIVIHEWWGLNDHIRHWADRLAQRGYAALAVDLFGGEVATTPERAMELVRAVDHDTALAILGRALAFVRGGPRVAAERVGVIGWCFGGGFTLEAAVELEGLDAVVMYYGRPITDVDRLRGIDAPLLGIFGERDASIPPADVDALERALSEAGVEHRILRFDAPHAFANPSGERYEPEAAEQAWEAADAFLAGALLGR